MARAMRKSFHVPGSRRHYLPDREYRTDHIKVELTVDPEKRTIAGRCSLMVVPLRRDLSELHFDASEMQVTKVQLDGLETEFAHDGERLTVAASGPLNVISHLVVVEYSASPRHGVYFVHPDEKYPDKPVQVWTQCESEAARFWYPCYDHPNDRSQSEMVITVPEGFEVISNGRLISKETNEGWTRFHWHEAAPHSTYLNSFVVGKFVKIEEKGCRVPIEYFVPKSKEKDAMRYFGKTPEMVSDFEEVTGFDYPYEKYSQVAVHDFIYGGMENISATTLTDSRFPDERSEEDYAVRYSRPDRDHIGLVAHELAHMWFGDLVTTRHWPHAWLNEGFATYMEAIYREKREGREVFAKEMLSKAQTYFELDDSRYRRKIVDDDYLYADDLFDACTYEKAAWMLHQLRGILGDELFFRGTQEYLRRFALTNADTDDYRRVMEEISGISLSRYFEQSFYRAGHPEFEIEYSWDGQRRTATVSVKQAQQVDDLTPIFDLPADLVFYTRQGRISKRVHLGLQNESFQFELDSEPKIVEFDPEGHLLKKVKFPKSFALLREQLASSVDVLSRTSAAEDLASFKSAETVGILRDAASKEQFWSVRAESIRSIAKIGGPDALEAVLELAAVKNRRVRRGAIAALSEFKGDERVQQVLREALAGDESPYNQCEAALSIGKLAFGDAVQTLSGAMKLESPEHGLAEACLEALGYTKSREARDIIRAHLAYGFPERVRIGSLKGYERLGSLEPEDVNLLKEVALKDGDFSIRNQLIEVVAELGDARFIGTLRRVAAEDRDNRNRRRAVEVLVEMESGEREKALSDLRDEVERLKGEAKELRGAVSRLERV